MVSLSPHNTFYGVKCNRQGDNEGGVLMNYLVIKRSVRVQSLLESNQLEILIILIYIQNNTLLQ